MPSTRDLLNVIRLMTLFVLSWVVPVRLWPPVCKAIAHAIVLTHRHEHRRRMARIAEWFRLDEGDPAVRRINLAVASDTQDMLMGSLRSYRWDGWTPHIETVGVSLVRDALDQGRGAILWVLPMPYSDLVSKMAFAAADLSVHHLSRPQHPLSDSWFGQRFINPIMTRIEERHLAERIVMKPDAIAAMRELRRLISRNAVVSVTMGHQGKQSIEVPCLGGHLAVASGVASLSRSGRTPIFPVFTEKRDDSGFQVVIDSALGVDEGASAREYLSAVAHELAERIERRHDPDRFKPIILSAFS